MKKIDKDIIKLLDLTYLLRKVVRGDDDARSEFDNVIKDNHLKNELLQNMSDESYLQNAVDNYIRADKDKNAEIFALKVKLYRQKTRRLTTVITSSIAAAVAVVSLLIYYGGVNVAENQCTVSSEHIRHYSVPTLITSSGDTIPLNKNEKVLLSAIKINQTAIQTGIASDTASYEMTYNTLIVPHQQNINVVLMDGTEVLLNSGTKLIYPQDFDGNTRGVTIVGEAYFKVTKSGVPFTVNVADRMEVRVYGTEFNINMNKPEFIETVLINGSIGILVGDGKEIIVKPSQLLRLNKSSDDWQLEDVDAENYLGWMHNIFCANKSNLEDVVNDMSVWYDVKFNFEDKAVREIKVSVNINRELTVDEVVNILAKSTGLLFIKEGKGKYMIR